MRPLSLDLRYRTEAQAQAATAPGRAAGASFLIHAAGITGLVVIPLLGSTIPPPPAGALLKPLVEPIRLVLPPARTPPVRRLSASHPSSPSSTLTPPADIPAALPKPMVLDALDPGVDPGRLGVLPEGTGEGLDPGLCLGTGLCAAALPTAPAPRPETVRVGGLIKEPRLAAGKPPQYPAVAQAAGVSGKVVIEARVGADGLVRECHVVKGHPLFDDAALASVRSRRYEPLLLNGVPIDFLVTVVIEFNLRR